MKTFSTALMILTLGLGSFGSVNAETTKTQWFAACKAQMRQEFGDALKRVRLDDIRTSDVRVRVSLDNGELLNVMCRVDRTEAAVVAFRIGEQEWQEVRLSAERR